MLRRRRLGYSAVRRQVQRTSGRTLIPMAHDDLTNDAIREGEPPVRTDHVIENQPPVHDIDRPKPRGALASVVLGLVSVAIGVFPGGLVFPLQVFLGEYPPVYLPFLTGALAFGL